MNKSLFTDRGIDVKIKYDVKYDYTDNNLTLPSVVEEYGEDQVREAFKVFCDDKGYEHKDGILLLNEFLKNK